MEQAYFHSVKDIGDTFEKKKVFLHLFEFRLSLNEQQHLTLDLQLDTKFFDNCC